MEILSNGKSLATLHRVKFTPSRERVSIPFFVAPENSGSELSFFLQNFWLVKYFITHFISENLMIALLIYD